MAQPAANAVGAGRVCIATATSSAAAWAGRPAIRPAMASRQGSTTPATERVTWKRRVRTVGAQRACRMIRPPLDVSRNRTSHRAQAYGSRRSYHRRRTPFSVARRIRRHRLEKQKTKQGLLLYREHDPAGRWEPGRSAHVHSRRIEANRDSHFRALAPAGSSPPDRLDAFGEHAFGDTQIFRLPRRTVTRARRRAMGVLDFVRRPFRRFVNARFSVRRTRRS